VSGFADRVEYRFLHMLEESINESGDLERIEGGRAFESSSVKSLLSFFLPRASTSV